MADNKNEQLVAENEELRRRIAVLEGIVADRTKSERTAEEALRRSKERFELAVRGAGVGIWDYDILAGKVFYSPRWKAMFGYTEDEIGDGLDDWARLLHPDERNWIIKLQDDFLAGTSTHVTAEYRLRHKDGPYRWIEAHGVVVRNEEGKAIRLVGSHGDITARKQAEKDLQVREKRFRNYFEQGLIGMAVTSTDGRWIDVNERLCRILGFERDELVQRTWLELTHPEDLATDLEEFNRLLEGAIDHYEMEKRFLRKDGGLVHTKIQVRAFHRKDGSIDHIVALMQDITDRKLAVEALRQSHDQLRAVYDGMVDGLTIEDLELHRITKTNEAFCRMLGISESDVNSLLLEDVHPQCSHSAIREEYKAHAEGKTNRSEAIPFLRRDGSIIYADITSNRIVYDGKLSLICFMHDITDRKLAEAALERERQSLWRMLQASDHERQIISYEIHDGLTQDLAGALMQLQAHDALRANRPDDSLQAYSTAVELVRQAYFEARRLITEVRPPVIDEVGLETAISHLVCEERRRRGKDIELHTSVRSGRLASVLENAIYRIVQEALTNACKHSHSDKVSISLTEEGQELCLKVQDWGVGFDLESVGKGKFGLEGIRQRVRLLGGRLTLESRPDSGTIIEVVVPILEIHA